MLATVLFVGILVGLGIAKLPAMNPEAGEANIAIVDLEDSKPVEPVVPERKKQPEIVEPFALEEVVVDIDDDPWLGSDKAKVVVIEFTDMQCSFCARHVQKVFPYIKKNYIDTGKIKYVTRDYPLGFHQFAQKAAEAANCAMDQDKYWEMHDEIFLNQAGWSRSEDAVGALKGYAEKLGLSVKEFNGCLDSGKYAEEVKNDIADATEAGVSGTPQFFIKQVGSDQVRRIKGAFPFSAFEANIEAALAGK